VLSGLPLSPIRGFNTALLVRGRRVAQRVDGSGAFLPLVEGFFATVALVLAVCGIYGVVKHTVSRRTPEIGLCLAGMAGCKARPKPGPAQDTYRITRYRSWIPKLLYTPTK